MTLENRIAIAERRASRAARLAVGAFVLAASIGIWSCILLRPAESARQSSLRTVDRPDWLALGTAPGTSRSLPLVDAAGHKRLELGLGASGQPSISMLDSKGVRRVVFSLNESDAPNLVLRDGENTEATSVERLRVSLTSTGEPSITLRDSSAVPRLALGSIEDMKRNLTGAEKVVGYDVVSLTHGGVVRWSIPSDR